MSHINPYSAKFNSFPNKPWFLLVYSKSLLKTLWENFSFSHSDLYPLELQTLWVWMSLNFVIWERINVLAILQTYFN